MKKIGKMVSVIPAMAIGGAALSSIAGSGMASGYRAVTEAGVSLGLVGHTYKASGLKRLKL